MGPIIVKGNHADEFTHPREYSDRPSYYWDNSLLPEIMPRPPDRSARQWWTRLVKAGPFPGEFTGTIAQVREREQAVNDYLRSFGQGERWDLLCRMRDAPGPRSDYVVWLEPQSQVTQWFYGESRDTVIDRVKTTVASQGLKLITRPKPARSQRWGTGSLRTLIKNVKPRCCLGVHSAAAQEVLFELTPYVSLGQSAWGDQVTAWSEFEQGHLRQPDPHAVYQRARELLTVTRNKGSELLTGEWSKDHLEGLWTPNEDWRLWT